ncbi:Rhodanese-like domain protein [Spraguea lophii 42_110]|uniref:M-phase inducer phosphatase n=1 Tax=Spraguea lophii (strain 42_110) TaxID=1358809 RepID=S7W837_SPRLO|nr:Rhodanese-like domain protein [Spraguea lophii 42_110]
MMNDFSSLEYNKSDNLDSFTFDLSSENINMSSLLSSSIENRKKRKNNISENINKENISEQSTMHFKKTKIASKFILTENNPNVLDLAIKKFCDEDIEPNNEILDSKPFNISFSQDHFSMSNKKTKIFSLPTNRKYLIDFWNDFDNGEITSLPTIGKGKSDSTQRITPITLNNILKRKYDIKYVIIDCRFQYEYEGGHIKKAINIDKHLNLDFLFKKYPHHIIIFYCEFSSIRAPRMAKILRTLDRERNNYPSLTFPEIYILDGGYKNFFKEYSIHCDPMMYTRM